MNWIRWMGVAAVLLTVTPAMAGEDLASCLETWPWSGGAAELATSAPVVDVLSDVETEESTPWRFHLTFYFLATELDATSAIDGREANVELSFSDIFDDLLEGAFRGRFEAWKGDFGLIANFGWISLGKGIEVAGPGPIGATANVDVELEQFAAFLG
jgi:hypothetical protein